MGRNMSINEPRVETVPISTYVRVRRHPIDQKELARYLKQVREKCGLSVRDIAERLSVPITEAEHWFRADRYGNIPDASIWYELKELLHLDTDRWDMAVTEFDMVENEYEYAQRCYRTSGLAPTLTNTEIKIEDRR